MSEEQDGASSAAEAPIEEPPEPTAEATSIGNVAQQRRHRRRRVAIEWTIVLIAALLLAFVIRTFAVQAFYIPSASMEPTLNIGDRILVDKAFFNYHDLKTGDIIVFHQPPRDTMCGPSETDLVKRVIGLPGDTIYSVGNNIYLNGKLLAQPWLPKGDSLGPAIPRQTIPKNVFYVLGDNRRISCDSRYWGPVAGNTIVGKVVLRWWHDGLPDLHFF